MTKATGRFDSALLVALPNQQVPPTESASTTQEVE